MAFVVVHFLETDEVAIISQSWLVDENTCKWPPYENQILIKRALLEKKAPEDNWKSHEIFILGVYKTYVRAKKEVDLALRSDSDDDDKTPERKRQKVQSILSNSAPCMPIVIVKSEYVDCCPSEDTIFFPQQSLESFSTPLQSNSITESQNNTEFTVIDDSNTNLSSDNSFNNVQVQCASSSSVCGIKTEDSAISLQSPRNSSSEKKKKSFLSEEKTTKMSGTLIKVWSTTEKKAVIATSFEDLLVKGKMKLNFDEENIEVFLQDGTHIDDNDVFQALAAGTVVYFIRNTDQKPWELDSPPKSSDISSSTPEVCFIEEAITVHSESPEIKASNVLENFQQPWPSQFKIPVDKFSSDLITELKSGNLTWATKSELLSHLAREIYKFTYKPNLKQRNEVASLLIKEFPTLKSKVGEGFNLWSQKIYDKVNEDSKKRNTSPKLCIKLPRRGEVNFCPAAPDFNITDSKKILQEEANKWQEDQDDKNVKCHMILTFSDRRSYINSGASVSDIKENYPILFTVEGVKIDFEIITHTKLFPTFLENMGKYYDKINEIASTKCTNAYKHIITDFTELPVSERTIADNIILAIRLLPFLLGDKNASVLYKEYDFETTLEEITNNAPEPLHICIIGRIHKSKLCYIVIERNSVMEVNNFLHSIILAFGLFYCLNMPYPSGIERTLKFFQTYIFKMPESKKLPQRVLTFCEKLP